MIMDFPAEVSMEDVLANSFADYHIRGFDYLCLKRSPKETLKLYFFDGDVSNMPEVVAPHDHRYDFATAVITGASQNVWYSEANPREAAANAGVVFERFAYDTPLLGGTGFAHVGQTRLIERERVTYKTGERYDMRFSEIHTIRLLQDQTVLALLQKEDRVTDRPTLTYVRGEAPPSLSGLYSKMTPDRVRVLLSSLTERAPWVKLPRVT